MTLRNTGGTISMFNEDADAAIGAGTIFGGEMDLFGGEMDLLPTVATSLTHFADMVLAMVQYNYNIIDDFHSILSLLGEMRFFSPLRSIGADDAMWLHEKIWLPMIPWFLHRKGLA